MLKANEKQFAVYCIFSTFVFSSFFDDFLVFFCKKVETWANPTKLRIVCMYECILLLLQIFYFFFVQILFSPIRCFLRPYVYVYCTLFCVCCVVFFRSAFEAHACSFTFLYCMRAWMHLFGLNSCCTLYK